MDTCFPHAHELLPYDTRTPALRPRRHPILRPPWACARGIGFVFASRAHPRRPWRARPGILASATCIAS